MLNTYGDMAGLVDEFNAQLQSLQDTQRRLSEISCTAASKRRVVKVTATHGGAIHSIAFTGDAYKRLAPVELAEVVLSTIRQAQDDVAAEAATVLAPTMPEGVDPARVLKGEVDLSSLMPTSALAQDILRDAADGTDEENRA